MEAYYVTGMCPDGGHAWNIVKIDGEYYHIDTTFDDSSNSYEFFLCPDGYMSATRECEDKDFPSCNSYKYIDYMYKEVSSEAEAIDYAYEQICKKGWTFIKSDFKLNGFKCLAERFMCNIQICSQIDDIDGEHYYYTITVTD